MGIYQRIKKRVDFIYVAPALLCNVALLCGIIPSAFCLSSALFVKISMGVFVFSIAIHIYILCQWRRYRNSSPFAYGVVQPCLHFVIMVIAMTVGSTSMCAKPELSVEEQRHILKDYEFKFLGPTSRDSLPSEDEPR